MTDTTFEDVIEDVRRGMGDLTNGQQHADGADTVRRAWPPLLVDHPLAAMQADQPQRVVNGLLTRKNTTLISSQGGVGKSCLFMQAAVEMALGRPVWGVPELIPHGRRVLYLNAEDDIRNIHYWLAKILTGYDLQTCPFTICPAKEAPGGNFVLSDPAIAWLIEVITAGAYDALFIDTAISVMELPTGGNAYIDPLAIRGWLRRSVGAIERRTDAAVALAVHDSKDGKAASGPADWRNFARLVLQLEASKRDGILTLKTIKGNLGFPYNDLTLDRDFRTLTATFTAGTKMGHQNTATPRTAEEITSTLTDLFNHHVRLLPPERRRKESVEAILVPLAAEVHIPRQKVRDFIHSAVRFVPMKGRGNPQLAVGLHGDPPTPEND